MEIETISKWKIDTTHSEIGFKVKHMMISTVRGKFDKFEANIESDEDFNNPKMVVTIDTNSINTGNDQRDGHLKSDDFFSSEKFPIIKFESISFDGEKLIGNLTIRDITKEVELDVDFNGIALDPYGQTKAGFEIKGEVSRKDFDLKWNAVTEAGSIVVSDIVKIEIDVQLIKL